MNSFAKFVVDPSFDAEVVVVNSLGVDFEIKAEETTLQPLLMASTYSQRTKIPTPIWVALAVTFLHLTETLKN